MRADLRREAAFAELTLRLRTRAPAAGAEDDDRGLAGAVRDSASFLAGAGYVAVFTLVVVGPFLFLAFLAWAALRRRRRRADEALLGPRCRPRRRPGPGSPPGPALLEPRHGGAEDRPGELAGTPDADIPQDTGVPGAKLPASRPGRGVGPGVEKDPDEWLTGGEPMTDAQASTYLRKLCDQAGEEFDEKPHEGAGLEAVDELRLQARRSS